MEIKRSSSYGGVAILVLALGGCGKSDATPAAGPASVANPSKSDVVTPTATAADKAATAGQTAGATGVALARPQGDGPETAVWDFLEAVRTGNDAQATKMLTPLARTKVGEKHMSLAPPGTDTARFVIANVERLAEDGARVSVDWTDLDYNGKPRTDQTIWMARKEAEGWRIAGMAVPVFEGEPPVLMNFEDPDDMLQKQKMVHDEIQRRSQAKTTEGTTGGATAAEPDGHMQQTAENVSASQPPATAQGPAISGPATAATQGPAAPENSFRR